MEKIDMLLKRVDDDAKNMLSEKRYIHSLNVMKRAEELAMKYGVDIDKAKLIGLSHDIAKEMSKNQLMEYVKKYNLNIDEYEIKNLELLHGKIGAIFCMEKYDFTEDMQKAIQFHTTGSPDMDDLAKILFIADKTERGRKHIDFKKVAEKENEGIIPLLIYTIDNSILYIIEKGKCMHPETIITRNYFILKKSML